MIQLYNQLIFNHFNSLFASKKNCKSVIYVKFILLKLRGMPFKQKMSVHCHILGGNKGKLSLYLPREMKRVKYWLQKLKRSRKQYVMHCTVWHYLYHLKNVKSTHGEVLVLVKFHAEACNFTKSNTRPWVFFTFLKFYKSCKASYMPSFY